MSITISISRKNVVWLYILFFGLNLSAHPLKKQHDKFQGMSIKLEQRVLDRIIEFDSLAKKLSLEFCYTFQVEDIRDWWNQKLPRGGKFLSKNEEVIQYFFHDQRCDFEVNDARISFPLYPKNRVNIGISPPDLWEYISSINDEELLNAGKKRILDLLLELEENGFLENEYKDFEPKIYFNFYLTEKYKTQKS
jgi:hypothetical protein